MTSWHQLRKKGEETFLNVKKQKIREIFWSLHSIFGNIKVNPNHISALEFYFEIWNPSSTALTYSTTKTVIFRRTYSIFACLTEGFHSPHVPCTSVVKKKKKWIWAHCNKEPNTNTPKNAFPILTHQRWP